MSTPETEYALLVNLVRIKRGLRPLPNVLPVDHPSLYLDDMRRLLEEKSR